MRKRIREACLRRLQSAR